MNFELFFIWCTRNGVDRSGVFVAASCIVERIKSDREVDVFQSIKQMRQNRSQLICNMVRNYPSFIQLSKNKRNSTMSVHNLNSEKAFLKP